LRPRRRSGFEPPRRPEPQTRINDAIRVPKVRLIGEDGEQLGVKTTDEAREYAYGKNLDLVEVAAQADPPVARVMDYGKYRYELEQKAKVARKHQTQINVKEIKLRPKIGIHDYDTKKGHVARFLNQRAKVKVTIMFRGREREHPDRGRDLLMRLAEDVKEIKLRPKIGIHDYDTKKGHVARFLNQRAKVKVTIMFRGREREHPDRGRDLLMRLAEDVKDIGLIETQPLLEGRNMTMVLGPTKNAGVKRDAETENTQRSEEEVHGDGDGEAAAAQPDVGQPHQQVAEAEAPVQ
jgi:translation initiation factor IF-3